MSSQINEPFGIQQVRSSDTSEENNIKTSGTCLSINLLGLERTFLKGQRCFAHVFVYVSQKYEGVMQRMLKSVSRILLSKNVLRVLSFVISHLVKIPKDSFIKDFE